jgi:type I restriction enzyme S subunit
MLSSSFMREQAQMLAKVAINQASIGIRDLSGCQICIAPSLAEQKAIAGVLSDIDEEIAALEAEKAKASQIKQGMMQELLTGRVRLGEGE